MKAAIGVNSSGYYNALIEQNFRTIFMSASGDVLIVIPVYQNSLIEFEKVSLRQAGKTLGSHPFAFVTCEHVETNSHARILSEYGVEARRILFHSKYFQSIGGYNRLLTSFGFYWKFTRYRYILIVQLDVFVFKDELAEWCGKGYDYIGAPWLEGFNDAGPEAPFIGVGNGGFSLRNVKSALRILRSFSYIRKPGELIEQFRNDGESGPIKRIGRLARDLTVTNCTFSLFNNYTSYEDHFWGGVADRNCDWYRVPDPDEALKFSMEVQPKSLYERNGCELPFGCHAWWRYDLEFWRPFIEKEGHVIPASTE